MAGYDSFADLVSRLRTGDDIAATQVFDRFANQLIALARSRLEAQLNPKLDAEDVLQSVYRSFFARQKAGRFELSGWNSLWAVLTVMTVRKCINQVEYFHAARRDVDREADSPQTLDESGAEWPTLAREPTPIEAAVLAEIVERLMQGLGGREREMVSLHLQGYTVPEIGARVDRAERTVRRVLGRMKKRLQRNQEAETEGA